MPRSHLVQSATAVAQQVDQRHAFGIEQLEGEPDALGRILDPSEGIGDVPEQVFALAQVAVLIAKGKAHLRKRVLGLAGALGGLGGTTDEALQRHVERLLLDAGRLGGEAQLLQRLDPDPDLVRGLADRVGRGNRAIHERGEAANRGHASERAAERADAGAQQLRLAAQVFEPARSFAARALDALQALLAALADRHQLGLDRAAALDRQADCIRLCASGHRSVQLLRSGVRDGARLRGRLSQAAGPISVRTRTTSRREFIARNSQERHFSRTPGWPQERCGSQSKHRNKPGGSLRAEPALVTARHPALGRGSPGAT
jgi:hypothetical protein